MLPLHQGSPGDLLLAPPLPTFQDILEPGTSSYNPNQAVPFYKIEAKEPQLLATFNEPLDALLEDGIDNKMALLENMLQDITKVIQDKFHLKTSTQFPNRNASKPSVSGSARILKASIVNDAQAVQKAYAWNRRKCIRHLVNPNPLIKSNLSSNDIHNIVISPRYGMIVRSIRFLTLVLLLTCLLILKILSLTWLKKVSIQRKTPRQDLMALPTSTGHLESATRRKKDSLSCWLDISNAFGSIHHDILLAALSAIKAYSDFVALVKNMYSDSSSSIICNEGNTEPIPCRRGVKQCCPLSGLLFNIAIDNLLRSVQGDYDSKKILAFADDLVVLAE
ncbi:retrovirus-related Pol polyprotein from type-2 retrotransposable element R2DM [Nephila pilipes]|uniref:Retrovirus-related Pol polyprotein from type-2 retrotransposable element R2DM n=1 Tax=Nephila pilipes TaxID=299642 RepID=A0A8X6PE36_NEPPI|nr:retrovirus-related Pol polyprotein from type-2 retrotransposable element R2DM [Nephila pilipes]